MKSILFLASIIFLSLYLNGQALDTLYFEKVYKPIESFSGMTEVYKLTGDSIYDHGIAYKITLPRNIDTSELAYCYIYFRGWENSPISRESVLLISSYKSDKPKIYVDENQNLNFSDDKAPLIFNGLLDTLRITLKNSKNPDGLFNVDLVYMRFTNQASKDRINYLYKTKTDGKKIQLVESKYWFSDRRRNSLILKSTFKGDSIMVGIHDYNCNGIYNDRNSDKIMVGNLLNATISSRENRGAYTFEDTTIIKLNKKYYEIKFIDESGKYMVLKSTEQKSKRIEIGDSIPNFNIKVLDGSVQKLHNILDRNKYTLIDVWGTWCAPCIAQTDELIRIYESNISNFQILALNVGDTDDKIKTYILSKNLKWLNGYLNKEIQNSLKIDGYPFLVLIDKDLKIVQIMATISDVERIVSKH